MVLYQLRTVLILLVKVLLLLVFCCHSVLLLQRNITQILLRSSLLSRMMPSWHLCVCVSMLSGIRLSCVCIFGRRLCLMYLVPLGCLIMRLRFLLSTCVGACNDLANLCSIADVWSCVC